MGKLAEHLQAGWRCGFNLQKNGGFNMEHAYSTGELEIKNFYVPLQIAHLILQLMERAAC